MDDEPFPGIEEALDRVRAFAQRMCEEAGDPAARKRLVLNHTGARLTFSTLDAASCGSAFSGLLKPDRAHVMVRNCLNRILRQRSRLRAIAAAGDVEDGAPAWSIDIHPATLSVLIHAGVNPALAATLGSRVATDDALKRAAAGGPIRIGDSLLIAGRVSIATVSGTGHPTEDVVSLHEDTQRLQYVTIRSHVPQTLVAALPGRALGEVTDHPSLARAAGVRIATAHASGDVLTLGLEDERVTLAPPPDGAPWLRFPWFTPADGPDDPAGAST